MTAPFGAPPALNALGPPALGRSALLSSSLVHHARGRQLSLMNLDGKNLEAEIATGNAQSSLYSKVTKQLFGFDEHSGDVETVVDPTGGNSSFYRAMKLSGGGLAVLNARIQLVPGGCGGSVVTDEDGASAFGGCFGIYPFRLGIGVLRKLRLYLSARDEQMYFTTADATRDASSPANRRLSGIAPTESRPRYQD